jgi:hypothetical protein
MKFTVYLLRRRGVRLAWREVRNGPRHTGQLTSYRVDKAGESFNVAALSPDDPQAERLVPDLFEPVLIGLSPLALRLRGFERIENGEGTFAAVQEWHCELP